MTLQTQETHVAAQQEPRIRASVGLVAAGATGDGRRQVLEDERSLLIGMALEAGFLLDYPCRSIRGPSVRIVAIATV